MQQADSQENVYLYIPNNAVGAIIGTKGSQIRNMIRFSNASIKIAAAEGEKVDSNERKVTIVGTPEAQWKVNQFQDVELHLLLGVCLSASISFVRK